MKLKSKRQNILPSPQFWQYAVCLWPLPVVLFAGQMIMHISGNSAFLGISMLTTFVDLFVFFGLFLAAAVWVFRPLGRCLKRLKENNNRSHRLIEGAMAEFPWRAMRGFALAGLIYGVYLVLVIGLLAGVGEHNLSLRMFLALLLSFMFGAGVLAPALAVANSIAHSTQLRLMLAKKGMFIGQLHDARFGYPLTSSSRRPWLVFLVTGFLPTLILTVYVYLALAGIDAEEHFILAQASVLLGMSILASGDLVWTISRTLKRVTGELGRGLKGLAAGQFDARVPILVDDDLGELARGLNTALEGLREREDLKDSLVIAEEIQQGLLPKSAPQIADYSIYGFQQTCYSVGGDYYDHIELDDGRVWLMIADVSGKGYPAALTMANLQAMLRGLAQTNWPIEEAANYLNEALCESLTAGRFVTLFMAKLQPQSHSLIWMNAGHVPPLLLQEMSVQSLEAMSPPLGVLKGVKFEVQRTELAPGDTLFAYTDGVTEASDAAGRERYGEVRLNKWLTKHRQEPLAGLTEDLIEELNRFGRDGQDDDLTVLSLRREA
ncbi:MAG: SpoIIE family protein phosphatase [Mariprofundaceae bacterium]